jgi:molybdate transport system substrate-binding protein
MVALFENPMRTRRPVIARTFVVTAALLAISACRKAPAGEISVAAATSLREVTPELVRAYEALHAGQHVAATYGASGDLRKQVEVGAPVDAVLFAGARPLDELVKEGRVEGATRRVVASNEIVLVGSRGGAAFTFASLNTLAKDERLAVGDPRTVPAGEYARDYLMALGEWDALQPHLVFGSNVAATLVYVRRGEATVAVVYRTELREAADLVVMDAAHGVLAPHPTVVGGVVHGGRPGAGDFLNFVASPEGEKVLASFGFGPP